VHNGTQPHDIVAKNAQALHFVIGGQDVFVTKVHHPGTRAQPFLTDSLHLAAV
jgi:hypothetical protein